MTSKLAHTIYLVVIGVLLIFSVWTVHAWLERHDEALLLAQDKKATENQIEALKLLASQQKTVVIRQVESVKTPAQAVAVIPTLTDAPLNARVAVDNPAQVSVDAVTLTQELGSCRQDRIDLGVCQSSLVLKDKEIAAIKQPSVWHRIGHDIKVVAITTGVVAVIAVAAGAHK